MGGREAVISGWLPVTQTSLQFTSSFCVPVQRSLCFFMHLPRLYHKQLLLYAFSSWAIMFFSQCIDSILVLFLKLLPLKVKHILCSFILFSCICCMSSLSFILITFPIPALNSQYTCILAFLNLDLPCLLCGFIFSDFTFFSFSIFINCASLYTTIFYMLIIK